MIIQLLQAPKPSRLSDSRTSSPMFRHPRAWARLLYAILFRCPEHHRAVDILHAMRSCGRFFDLLLLQVSFSRPPLPCSPGPSARTPHALESRNQGDCGTREGRASFCVFGFSLTLSSSSFLLLTTYILSRPLRCATKIANKMLYYRAINLSMPAYVKTIYLQYYTSFMIWLNKFTRIVSAKRLTPASDLIASGARG